YHSAHLSSHQHALPGRTSPSRRNNHYTEDLPTQPRFLQWAKNPFSHTRNSGNGEGVEKGALHVVVPKLDLLTS
ncbi:hypothetical protein M405DRAFT_817776, partial [Rhizopogon salebrosus TDB-379]